MTSFAMPPVVEIARNPEQPEVEIGTVEDTRPISTYTYETRRWPYLLTLPFSVILTLWVAGKKLLLKVIGSPAPKINTFWFDGLGSGCRSIKVGEASWRALDVIYNWQFFRSWTLAGLVDDFWIGMVNAQAVRNRFKLVKQELRRAILSIHEDGFEVRLMSLASGSAQAVLEVMAQLKHEGIVVQAMLVDKDQTALTYAQKLAVQYEVSDQIKIFCGSVSQVTELAKEFKPEIIEMLGLLDYFSQAKAISLARQIYRVLPTKGWFLTCNVARNFEMWFLWFVINWPMIYRRPADLAEIVTKAGFGDYRIIYEPHKVHGLVITQKV